MKLIIEDDEGRRTVVPIVRDELNIGRADTNTILLTEKNVSRKHARLLREEGRFFIEDLQSFTGVKVNGERVLGKRPVTAGDLIQISEYDLFLQPAPGESLPPGDEELVDEDVIVTGPIKVVSGEGEQEKETSVIRMENVSGAGQAEARILAPGERPRLHVIEGSLAGKEFELSRTPIAIGRTVENDVQLDDGTVSRYHCKLFLEGDSWKLLDNRSAHGVKVNGEPYATCRVRPGDTLEIGHLKLRFLAPEQAVGEPAQVPPPPPLETPAQTARAAPAELAPASPPAVVHGLKKLIGPAIAACMAIALAVFVVQRNRPQRVTASAPAPTDDDVQIVAIRPEVIQAELAKAQSAQAAHRFAESLQHFEAAQKAGASAEELRAARTAQAELRDEQSLKKLDASIAAQRWDDAKSQLDALPTPPGFFADQLRARTAAVRKGYVDDHLARAEAMRAQGNVETCAEEAKLSLAADAASARAKQTLAACASVPPTPPPPQPVAQLEPRHSEKPAEAPPPPTPPRVLPPTHEAQATVNVETTTTDEGPVEPDAPARRLVGEGNQKLLAEDFESAIGLFQRALALKPSEPILATLYRSMGIALTRQGNIVEGAHYYRLYLPLCTNQTEKEYLTRTLEEYETRRR